VLYWKGAPPAVRRDEARALEAYERGAALGSADAMLCLADALSSTDAAAAEEWVHHAAWLGHPAARGMLREAGAEPRRPAAVAARSVALRAKLDALRRGRSDARLAPRPPKPPTPPALANPKSPTRPRIAGGDRSRSSRSPRPSSRAASASARGSPRPPCKAAARLPKPTFGSGL